MRAALLLLAALVVSGCATRELVLKAADAPWAAEGASTVELPTFQGDPAAWSIADQARTRLRDALARGTARVVEDRGQLVLQGAVAAYLEQASPGAPRRILRTTGSSGNLPATPYSETYAWEMDVDQAVQVRLVLRLQTPDGTVLWTKEASGDADESHAVLMNWPGNDPLPPPAVLPKAPDPEVFQRLRERALAEALEPLLAAVTVRYAYERVD